MTLTRMQTSGMTPAAIAGNVRIGPAWESLGRLLNTWSVNHVIR